MSYIAIARKWRPQRFDEIAGQKHITKTLENAISRDRVHHAYLFSGPRGVGKTTAARTLARSLNCEQGPSLNPCSQCSNCLEILAGNNPDVVEIDGASNNSVDNIRDLRESVQFLPAKSPKRIYIIDEVHMLSKGAFNALLKTLEEPPKHVLFIFATTEPQKIPDTILSRVQRFEFKRIPAKTVTNHLQNICDAEGITIAEGGLQLIARAGEGSMRDSQSLLDQVISFGGKNISVEEVSDALGLIDRSLIYNMLEGIVYTDAQKCLHAINKVYDYGYDLSEFSSELLELIRNVTMVQLTEESNQFLEASDADIQQLQKIANKTTPDVLVRSFQVMLDIHEQLTHSTRPKLVLEMAVARLISIRPVRSIDSLIERLSKIEGSPRTRESTDDPLPARGDIQNPAQIEQSKQKLSSGPQPQIKKETFTQTLTPVSQEQKLDPHHALEKQASKKQEANIRHDNNAIKKEAIPPSPSAKREDVYTRLKNTKHVPPAPPSSSLNKKESEQRDLLFKRFENIRAALQSQGSMNDVLAHHTCIVEENDTKLTLGISDGFKLEHIQERLKDKAVRELFSQFFPNAKSIVPIAKEANPIWESAHERSLRIREEMRHLMISKILSEESYQRFTKTIPTEFHHLTLEEEKSNDNN